MAPLRTIPPPPSKKTTSVSKSLRDQLVAAGLASQAEAKKAEKVTEAGRRRRHQSKSKNRATTDGQRAEKAPLDDPAAAAKERAREARLKKVSEDRERAKAENERAARIALRAEIKQLVVQHDQRRKETRDDDVPYNFVHDKRVKRFYVGADQVARLSRGELIVVHNKGKYYVIDRETADRVRAKDPSWIVVAHDEASKNDATSNQRLAAEEAAYEGFEIPDDLDW